MQMELREDAVTKCPQCGADFDGGEIPNEIRHNYSPPYRWNRAILVKMRDGEDYWKCPDCNYAWR
jgi:uncharacterized C2H2 Zn-finger protein